MMWFFLVLSCLSYALAAFFRVLEKVSGRPMTWHGWGALIAGFGGHLGVLFLLMGSADQPTGFPTQGAPLAAGLILVFICTILEITSRESFFTIFVLPLVIGLVGLSPLARAWLTGTHFQGGWFFTHVAAAVAGECFFLMAGLSAAASWYEVRKLKGKNRLRAMKLLPPLTRLDGFIVQFITMGFTCFALGLALGCYWSVLHFGRIDLWQPKQVGSIAILAYFAILLSGRYAGRITGPRLTSLTIIGSVLSLAMTFFANGSMHWFPGGN